MIGRLNDKETEHVLLTNVLGRIGCAKDGKIYVVPINYVYNGTDIIAHSLVGLKIWMMRENPSVCFEVDEMKDHANWRSVIAWGEYEEITDEPEKYQAMKLFVDRLMHLKISETAVAPELTEKRVHPRTPEYHRVVVFRIRLTEKTGRFESSLKTI